VRVCCVSVVGRLDAELDDQGVAVSQTEVLIIAQYGAVSADERHQMREQVNEVLRPLGLETSLLMIKRANSLALFFTCMSLSAVVNLRDHWNTGQLRDIVESLFTLLSGATVTVRVTRLTWLETDYERCLESFTSLQGKQTV